MNSLKGYDKNQILVLKAYNIIKNHPLLIKLAESLEDEDAQKDLQEDELNMVKEVDGELSQLRDSLITHLTTKNVIESEKYVPKKVIRVYMDGVFDIIHSGHFNALRQGKKLGDYLVLGVNSDEDVEKAKGPPLMNVKERAALVGACKWVDEVIIDTPYTPTLQLLDELKIDFCVHGDDPCYNEAGEDVYAPMKKVGRFKIFKRTEGISTTDIIGRLLTLSRDTLRNKIDEGEIMTSSSLLQKFNEIDIVKGPVISSFLTTGWRLHEFCNNKVPKDTDKVVYLDGAWDILHIGHIDILKKAKEIGDFVYIGVHDDATVNNYRGKNYPILNMQERVFNLLALRYVDDVVIAAPWIITEDLIKSLKISVVLHGTEAKYDNDYKIESELDDPYHVAKKLGIYQEIVSEFDMNSEVLVKRIFEKRDHYLKKYKKKSVSEQGYYQKKEYINEI